MIQIKPVLTLLAVLLAIGCVQPIVYGNTHEATDALAAHDATQVTLTIEGMR